MAELSERPPRRRRRRVRRGEPNDELKRSLEVFHRFIVECQACQTEASPHWQYCAECGSRLATQCPGCGSPLPPLGARYCPHCGIKIPEEE